MTSPVTIVDYGVGNLMSISNMIKKAGFTSTISSDLDEVRAASKILLPGVGSFDRAAVRLRESGLRDVVIHRANADIPVLGVCLGMQLLLETSEEGIEPGLGLIAGRVRRFPAEVHGQSLTVPHMGWSHVTRADDASALASATTGSRFYFVHSYFAEPASADDAMGITRHGVEFASMVRHNNIMGVQFHPEKSHRMGLALLTDFASM